MSTRQISRAVLLLAGIFLAWFWLRAKPAVLPTTQMPGAVIAAASPATDSALVPVQASPSESARDTFALEFKKCFPDSNLIPLSSQDWLRQAERASEIESRKLTLQNLHIRLSNGVERRLQIAPIKQKIEIREFDVDSENLPIPAGPLRLVPSEDTEQVRDDFLRQGEKIYDQRKEVLRFKDGAYVDLDYENDKVHDLKFFHDKISFYCRANDCLCKPFPPAN